MNERLRILKLLEEGKINADEAARLLEVVSQPEHRWKRSRHKIWSSFEHIPEIIATAIDTSFKHAYASESLHFPKKKTIEFKGISGNLTIVGTTNDGIEIQKDGYAKFKEKGDMLSIKALSGDIAISTPHDTNCVITGISGDLRLDQINGTFEIESVSGDITGTRLSGVFMGELVSGDIDLDFSNVRNIQIQARSGDITLRLDEQINTELTIETETGAINCDFDLKNEKKDDTSLTGIINNPDATIKIKNKSGDVLIVKRQANRKEE